MKNTAWGNLCGHEPSLAGTRAFHPSARSRCEHFEVGRLQLARTSCSERTAYPQARSLCPPSPQRHPHTPMAKVQGAPAWREASKVLRSSVFCAAAMELPGVAPDSSQSSHLPQDQCFGMFPLSSNSPEWGFLYSPFESRLWAVSIRANIPIRAHEEFFRCWVKRCCI